MPDGIGNPAASRRRDVEGAVPYGYQKCSINSVGNAVPGVPGDRKGRPYAISQGHPRRGGALTRPPMPRASEKRRTSRKLPRHCEERSDVAIRISPAPAGPGGALRRRGYGLPRPCGLAMTVVIDGWCFCFALAMTGSWSAGAVPPPYRAKNRRERRPRRSGRPQGSPLRDGV